MGKNLQFNWAFSPKKPNLSGSDINQLRILITFLKTKIEECYQNLGDYTTPEWVATQVVKGNTPVVPAGVFRQKKPLRILYEVGISVKEI